MELYKAASEDDNFPEELRLIWGNMSREESEHQEYWQKLLEAERDGLLPDIFDDPRSVYSELEKDFNDISETCRTCALPNTKISTEEMLAATFRIEFYMANRAFSELFGLKIPGLELDPVGAKYEHHLTHLLEITASREEIDPNILMLGKAILKLWKETNAAVSSSIVDQLTGLANRRNLYEYAKQWIFWATRHERPVGLLMIDIDDFKNVNDLYGHHFGDDALVEIAKCLSSSVRESDKVARYGGEEFVVLAPDTDGAGLNTLAKKILKNIDELVHPDLPERVKITVSIGGAFIICDGRSSKDRILYELIGQADSNLYSAKDQGKACYVGPDQ